MENKNKVKASILGNRLMDNSEVLLWRTRGVNTIEKQDR